MQERSQIATDNGLKQLFNLTREAVFNSQSHLIRAQTCAAGTFEVLFAAAGQKGAAIIDNRNAGRFQIWDSGGNQMLNGCDLIAVQTFGAPHFQHDRGARLLLLSAEELAARQYQ